MATTKTAARRSSKTTIDRRRPSEVTDSYRQSLAELLIPRGFIARAKGATFVRKAGRNTHRIELSSSHHNGEGWVACQVHLEHQDSVVRRAVPTWSAAGNLGLGEFSLGGPIAENVASSAEAATLTDLIVKHLAFFALLDAPADAFAAACRGYVPGFIDPLTVVPYLRVHLGADAVAAYARSLLDARHELWPGFLSSPRDRRPDCGRAGYGDHGTQLAQATTSAELSTANAPSDAVRKTKHAYVRSTFGLKLRAWGEPEAAANLRTVSDDSIRATQRAVEKLDDHTVDSREAARLVLRAATGKDRDPCRKTPSPRLYQYYLGHAPFASAK